MSVDLVQDDIRLALEHVDPPFYVYSLDEVRAAYRQLRAVLPEPSRILYSLKANPHPDLVRALIEEGAGVEICSTGELDATHEADVPPDLVLYTGPGKRDAEVEAAIAGGVTRFSVDSLAGLRQIDVVARCHGVRAECLVRLNDSVSAPGQGLAMTGRASQFGADIAVLQAQSVEFQPYCTGGQSRSGASIVGLHVYQGSNLDSEDALVAQFDAALTTCRRAATALRLDPAVIDVGGGFGAPYARLGDRPPLSMLADRLAALLDHHFPGWHGGAPTVIFESGRYLAGRCGQLVTRVADVKISHDTPVVVLESGINHLGGMSGLRRLPPIAPDVVAAGAARESVTTSTLVAGPLCTPLDSWTRSAELPPLSRGDLVSVPNVGAYGLSASLVGFLSHPCPAEVVLEGGSVVSVSRVDLSRNPLPRSRATAAPVSGSDTAVDAL